MNTPYERIVQWAAGPVSVCAGVAATKLTEHLTFLGQVGLSHNAIAHAIVAAMTFAIGAGVTYAAHHKWLENLAKWWVASGVTPPAVLQPSTQPEDPSTVTANALRAQVRSLGGTPEV